MTQAEDAGETPERAALAFSEALQARDPEAAAACLSPLACLLTPDGTAIHGRAPVREILAQMTITHPLERVDQRRMLRAGTVAAASQSWIVSPRSPAEGVFEQALSAQLVLGRGEGRWRLLVVAPWGF